MATGGAMTREDVEKQLADLAEKLSGELYGTEGYDVLRTDSIMQTLRQVREETIKECAKAQCSYCAGRVRGFDPVAVFEAGPFFGTWDGCYVHKGPNGEEYACGASGILALMEASDGK